MYTIKTESFLLEFTPVADAILVKVVSDDFAASCCFDAEDFLIADFALRLKDMYEKLEGSAMIRDLYETDSFIEFTAQTSGHIAVRGKIISRGRRNTQQLTFENDIEQTYLRDFVRALAADYAGYAE